MVKGFAPKLVLRTNNADEPSSTPRRRVVSTLVVLVLILHVVVLFTTFWRQTAAVPIRDEWAIVSLLQSRDAGELGLRDFFAFHNEHRIVLSRLIGLAVVDLSGWDRQIHFLIALALVGVTFGLLLAAVRRTIPSSPGPLALSVPLVLLLFSHSRWENWLIPFTDKIPTALGVALCCHAFAARPFGRWWSGVAVAGAAIASLSSMGGLAVWLAFLPAAIQAGRRFALAWSVTAVAVIWVYLIDFPRGDAPFALAPLQLPGFILGYLGAPVASSTDLRFAQVAALISVVVVTVNGLIWWRFRGLRPAHLDRVLPWCGLALFAFGTALLGAIARGPHGGTDMGLTSRYHAFALYWWVGCLVLIYLSTTHLIGARASGTRTPPPARVRAVIAGNTVAALAVLAAIVGANIEGIRHGESAGARYRTAESCFLAYHHATDECLEVFYAQAPWLPRNPDYLERQRLALFRNAERIDPLQLAVRPANDTGMILNIGGIRVADRTSEPVHFRQGAPLILVGWGFDPLLAQPAAAVLVTIDDHAPIWVQADRERPALAIRHLDPAYRHTGYRLRLPAGAMTPGDHTITVQVVSADLQSVYDPNPHTEIVRVHIAANQPE